MSQPRAAWHIFIAIQFVVMLAATCTLDRWGVFRGIVSAQAALVGVGLGVASIPPATRRAGAILAVVLFAAVVTTLALRVPIGGLFGMHGSGWQFLMWMVRVLVVGGICWQAILCKGYVLSSSGEPMNGSFLRFRLHHLLALLSLVAMFFVVRANLGGPYYGILLVLLITILGVAYAAMSLFASLLALEPTPQPARVVAYLLGILLISLVIAVERYVATDRWASAQHAWLEVLVEVAWILGSLLALRMNGYQIAAQRNAAAVPTLAADRAPSTVATHVPRFGLKSLFLAVTLFAVWLGWNISLVKKREHLRALVDARSVAGQRMAVVTHAEGSAAASQEVKHRIAPFVLEAYRIRNRGGTMIGARGSARLSLVRSWLGDEPVYLILLDSDVDSQKFKSAFPEAMIVIRRPPDVEANAQ